MLHTTPRFASAFRAFRGHALCPALCPNSRLGSALPFEGLPPLPWRSSLRSELYCLGSSSLIRPHASHWWAHPDFTALPLIQECLRCAGAPKRPTSGSVLSMIVPSCRAVLKDLERSIDCFCSVLRRWHWPSPNVNRFGTSIYPVIRFRRDEHFAAATARNKLLAPLADLTRLPPSHQELLLPSFQRFGHPPRCRV